jgi:endonuclease YncB( thermonuclease family)
MRDVPRVLVGTLCAVALAAFGCAAGQTAVDSVATTATASVTPTPASIELLYVSDQKDGDSFVASNGKEFGLGLVNTPELDEPCGRVAREFSRRFLADGFTADAYAFDRYGRAVAEVFDPSGRSLNLALAASGLGNGRYLNQYRHENPDLAERLEAAFAEAKAPSCG